MKKIDEIIDWLRKADEYGFTISISVAIADKPSEKQRPLTCPVCRHAYHGDGPCLNASSDNDCDCKGCQLP